MGKARLEIKCPRKHAEGINEGPAKAGKSVTSDACPEFLGRLILWTHKAMYVIEGEASTMC